MVKRRGLLLACVLGLLGCGTTFNYRYYGLEADSYGGKLLGPKPKDDIPFSVCAPDEHDKGKCAVILRAELEKLMRDYADMRERLKACEEKP
jgi:hypothetical protein